MGCGYYFQEIQIGNSSVEVLKYRCISDYVPYKPDILILYLFVGMFVLGGLYLIYRHRKKNTQ